MSDLYATTQAEEKKSLLENAYRNLEKKYRISYLQREVTDSLGKKRYKKPKLAPPPSYDDVLNFSEPEKNTPINKQRLIQVSIQELQQSNAHYVQDLQAAQDLFNKVHGTATSAQLALPDLNALKFYTLQGYPGFYYIPKLLAPAQQLHWIRQCLEVYPEEPNVTNHVITHGLVPNVFKNANTKEGKQLLEKMTWCTLGYQYDWSNRKYHQDRKVPFPNDAGALVNLIACMCGYGPYVPEAAIVNFYQPEQTMGGHLDNAEYEMKKPIVSLSFGSKAIFLLGAETKDVEPIPLFLESGDVMIMGGRARYCYHGIARIMHNSIPDYLKPENVSQEFKPHCEYLCKNRRLNINVRQVFEYDAQGNAQQKVN